MLAERMAAIKTRAMAMHSRWRGHAINASMGTGQRILSKNYKVNQKWEQGDPQTISMLQLGWELIGRRGHPRYNASQHG